MVHSIALLLIVLVAAPFARFIPLATFSGVLMVVAWRMGEWHNFGIMARGPRGDFWVLLVTFALTVGRRSGAERMIPPYLFTRVGIFFVRKTIHDLAPPGTRCHRDWHAVRGARSFTAANSRLHRSCSKVLLLGFGDAFGWRICAKSPALRARCLKYAGWLTLGRIGQTRSSVHLSQRSVRSGITAFGEACR